MADFPSLAPAREAARRIREQNLGEAQVDTLAGGRWSAPGTGPATGPFGPDDPTFLSAGDLGPLSSTDLSLVRDALDHPGAMVARRPRQGDVLLTVVTEEENVPAVVAIIKQSGGSV